MSDFDILLHRRLRDGREYGGLIPKTNCTATALGEGLTDFSIVHMADLVQEYSWQMEKVAPLLQKRSLQDTCWSIHDFTYNHFQYRADEEDQLLRSPACSWHDRQNGIDCKSYSIIASCLLTEMGINHFIRKIKQPGFAPEEWTHVYVIVPNDQRTASLAQGYQVIDGTIDSMNEPAFIAFKDEIMSGLKHYALNGIGYGRPLNGSINLNSILGSGGSCSGSSTTPQEVKALFPAGLQQTIAACGLLSNVTTDGLNKFIAIMHRMDISGGKLLAAGGSGCTGQAGKFLSSVCQQTIKAVLSSLATSGFSLTPTGARDSSYTFTFSTYNAGNSISTNGYPSDTYSVSGIGTLQFNINSLDLTITGGSTNTPIATLPTVTWNSGNGGTTVSATVPSSTLPTLPSSATAAQAAAAGVIVGDPDPDSGLGTTGTVLMVAAGAAILYAIFGGKPETKKAA